MEIRQRTADQVRIPRVAEGEAVIVTRHGREIAAIVAIEDYRLLEGLKAAIAASRVPRAAVGPATLAAEAGDLDDDEFPGDDEVARILGEGA